jgi:hypothetical protein
MKPMLGIVQGSTNAAITYFCVAEAHSLACANFYAGLLGVPDHHCFRNTEGKTKGSLGRGVQFEDTLEGKLRKIV